ncbi:MAG TPA: YafY family protein [Stellaceae bacterium]|nr:YafY family protein [Stellaceae bacterium]
MRRADRLFEIVQLLRGASAPSTAASLAAALEVTVRTVYRDIAALQARRVPIEGERGVGYVLRKGFTLPPLMFTADEIDAIAVGVRLVRRIRDPKLQKAAAAVLSKVTAIVPDEVRPQLVGAPLYVSDGTAVVPHAVELAEVRHAIREARKMRIDYVDEAGSFTRRTVWPIAMVYYVDVTLIAGWCELRKDFRHFRVERIQGSEVLQERFPTDNGRLLRKWLVLQEARSDESDPRKVETAPFMPAHRTREPQLPRSKE